LGSLNAAARAIHVVLLSLWFGSGVFFAAVLAPAAFQVLPTRDLAGELISTTLSRFDLFGTVAGPFLVMTLVLGWLPLQAKIRIRMGAIIVMSIAAACSGRFLTPTMIDLRHSMGRSIADVDPSDPMKIEFGRLHAISTGLMTLNLILALVLIVLAIVSSAPKKKHGIEL
jgi:hypothetical protein